MTRLLATGDLHLGAGLLYGDDRIADQARVLAQITAIAKSNDVDAVMVAGDVFHRAAPPVAALHTFRAFTDDLTAHGIPVIAITGNKVHDIVNADEPCALELFAGGTVHVHRLPDVDTIGETAVACLPNVPADRLVSLRGGRDDDVNAEAVALLIQTAAELRAQIPASMRSVLLGHWSVTGACLPNGLPSESLIAEPVLPLDALEGQGWDAVVLGHLHRPQLIGSCSLYTGSPQTVDFGEAGVEHGVWILDFDAEGTERPEFVPVHDRPFVTIDLDLTTYGGEIDDSFHRLVAAGGPVDEAVVRVRLRCSEEQARRIDQAAIRDDILGGGAHRVWQVSLDVVRGQRARVAGVDETLDVPAALGMWASANAIEQADLAALQALTIGYLGGDRG